MILYLTSNANVNLLDFLEEERELPVKKLVGQFSLLSFVVKDMRHFAHVRYIALDRTAITESDEELVQALLSYLTIYDIRVVLIAEGLFENSPFLHSIDAGRNPEYCNSYGNRGDPDGDSRLLFRGWHAAI